MLKPTSRSFWYQNQRKQKKIQAFFRYVPSFMLIMVVFFFHSLYIVQPLCTLLYLFGVLFHCAVVIRLYGWCGNLVCHSGRCRCNFFPHQMCSNLLLQLLLHTHTHIHPVKKRRNTSISYSIWILQFHIVLVLWEFALFYKYG